MRDVGLVVAAAGTGSRFDGQRNKLLCLLDGTPLVCHSLRNLLPGLPPVAVVVMVPEGLDGAFREALQAAGFPGEIRIAVGGATRQESVCQGIRLLPESVSVVAIQDGARPYTGLELLEACVASARRHGSGVAASRVTDTIKVADGQGMVVSTPDRTTLWAAETPQVFQRDLIERAYAAVLAEGRHVTDDAQAVEINGGTVHLVEHKGKNPKVTFAADLPESEQGALRQ